jgi:hypothetical protein
MPLGLLLSVRAAQSSNSGLYSLHLTASLCLLLEELISLCRYRVLLMVRSLGKCETRPVVQVVRVVVWLLFLLCFFFLFLWL